MELTEMDVWEIFKRGLPPEGYYISLNFLPTDIFIRQLTVRYKVEFAVIFKITANPDINKFYLIRGTTNQITFSDINKTEVFLKHSHPMGTSYPSYFDIDCMKIFQRVGSPLKKSNILPNKKQREWFKINSPYIDENGQLQTNPR